MLDIQSLFVSVQENIILHDINLQILPSEMHILMGPNGSGKSSLAYALMNHPLYCVKQGKIFFNQEDITHCSPDVRAQKGIFLAAQYQYAIPGVQVFNFLREAIQALHIKYEITDFYDDVCDTMNLLEIDQDFMHRNLNDGFSGGERKRFELLQLLLFNPQLSILDEIDSGLDINGLKIFQQALDLAREQNPRMSFLIITHNLDIARKLNPTHVHIMRQGRVTELGDGTLIEKISTKGYNAF